MTRKLRGQLWFDFSRILRTLTFIFIIILYLDFSMIFFLVSSVLLFKSALLTVLVNRGKVKP